MRRAQILAVSLLFCSVFLAGSAGICSGDIDVIFEDSFEDDAVGSCPDGWTCHAPYGHAWVVDSVACDGDKSLEISHGTPDEDANSISYQGLNFGCDEPFAVEYCLSTTDVDGGSEGLSLMRWEGFFYVNVLGIHIREGKFAWSESFDIHEIEDPLPVNRVSYRVRLEFEPPDSLRYFVDDVLVGEATASYPCDNISAIFLKVAWGSVATAHFDGIMIYRGETTPGLVADVEFEPDMLNCRSNAKYVTCYMEVPAGYHPDDIDMNSIILNGQVPALTHPSSVGDHDGDGIPDRMVKFDRGLVMGLVGGEELEARVDFSMADGTTFSGTDIIGIKCKEKSGKTDDTMIVAQAEGGSSTLIRYLPESQERVSVRVYDVRGRLVRTLMDDMQADGCVEVIWNGDTDYGTLAASGIYFVRLEAGDEVVSGKALMIK
jgi:hypothetical protein